MAKLTFRYYPQPLSQEEALLEKKIFKLSLVIPVTFLVIIWLIKISEVILGTHFLKLGMHPRNISGLIGILTSPLVHGDFKHLMANSTAFLILSTALFFFYRKVALKVFLLNYFMAGLFLWLGGREVIHIGASGVIYGMAAFLFLSGTLMKDLRLLTISLIVVFLYGSMVWGLLPIEPGVSWDGHLMGTVSGVILALLFYKQGPPVINYDEEKEDDDDDDEQIPWNESVADADITDNNGNYKDSE